MGPGERSARRRQGDSNQSPAGPRLSLLRQRKGRSWESRNRRSRDPASIRDGRRSRELSRADPRRGAQALAADQALPEQFAVIPPVGSQQRAARSSLACRRQLREVQPLAGRELRTVLSAGLELSALPEQRAAARACRSLPPLFRESGQPRRGSGPGIRVLRWHRHLDPWNLPAAGQLPAGGRIRAS